ncbi:hypothetical protein Plhal304r1_c025g0085251 [Plasmopara halstedii]
MIHTVLTLVVSRIKQSLLFMSLSIFDQLVLRSRKTSSTSLQLAQSSQTFLSSWAFIFNVRY